MKLNMRQPWYESGTLPSTWGRIEHDLRVKRDARAGRARVLPRAPAISFAAASWLMLCLSVSGCASGGGSAGSAAQAPNVGLLPGASPGVATEPTVTLAGSRCTGQSCACRQPGRDDEETVPPAEGSKRFEIRISAIGGTAAVDLAGLGVVVAPSVAVAVPDEAHPDPYTACAYIDVPSGSTHDVVLVSKESTEGQGVGPRLRIAEYGPKAHAWYDVVAVSCDGPGGRCDRRAAVAWSVAARQRKRGRLDPCGSAVVTRLAWETSGGQAERAGGLFRDFTVRFAMEIKPFATQFLPGSTECVPK